MAAALLESATAHDGDYAKMEGGASSTAGKATAAPRPSELTSRGGGGGEHAARADNARLLELEEGVVIPQEIARPILWSSQLMIPVTIYALAVKEYDVVSVIANANARVPLATPPPHLNETAQARF